jgi:hypothetical protein
MVGGYAPAQIPVRQCKACNGSIFGVRQMLTRWKSTGLRPPAGPNLQLRSRGAADRGRLHRHRSYVVAIIELDDCKEPTAASRVAGVM